MGTINLGRQLDPAGRRTLTLTKLRQRVMWRDFGEPFSMTTPHPLGCDGIGFISFIGSGPQRPPPFGHFVRRDGGHLHWHCEIVRLNLATLGLHLGEFGLT